MTTNQILHNAKNAALCARSFGAADRIRALQCMADAIIHGSGEILSANAADVAAAKGKINDVMIDRLRLTEASVSAMADGMRDVAALPDPMNKTISEERRPNGLVIRRQSVPFGVVAIIYESRPNVTSDAAAIAIKSGNAAVLRSGREAYLTSRAVVDAMRAGLISAALPPDLVNLIDDTSRASATELMGAVGLVDLLIPRGGRGLIETCVREAMVPCIQTGTGICHIYVDSAANLNTALNIVDNAKTSRPSVCNAAEVCLVHRDIAQSFLPMLRKRLIIDRINADKIPVRLRLDATAMNILSSSTQDDIQGDIQGDIQSDTYCTFAGADDFDTEFLDYIMAVAVVNDVKSAVAHITAHSTGHSEAIITEDENASRYFTQNTDSAAVYVNASTRFTDGGEFGMGCEMGISTQKLHARGPLGVAELTAYKYIITGDGQTR